MITRWTEAQLEAMLELDGLGQRVVREEELAADEAKDAPAILKGCICRNEHKPDDSGLIFTNPSCQVHGLHTKFVPMSRITEHSARTVGWVHDRKREN